ncbi:MAG TPA: HRDC domain-containing protein [Candidatus Saccharimonadales bacterium]|nr:HRDC domain-containing protein [Candidatus Saccharimonadales bacterium]
MSTDKTLYVDSPQKFETLLHQLSSHKVIGLDTEFISEGRYEPELCLVQLSTPDQIFIVDPIVLSDLRLMWELLAGPDREIVTVAARQEIKFCAKGAGFAPACVLDLQIAAGLLGYGYPLSHTNLCLRVINARVNGGESFTDWRKRPLRPVQLEYAADDVRHLLPMRDKLLARAQKMNRTSWVRGECEQLVKAVMREDERWRISGSSRLSRRQLAVLREVWRWRDRQASGLNVPVARVLGDSMLIEVARRSPATVEDLFSIRGLDSRLLRKAEQDVVDAVALARSISEADLPSNERRDDPPQVAVLSKLLSVAVGNLAAEAEVDTAQLATTSDIQELVRWFLNQDAIPRPEILDGWRGEILQESLIGFLEGRKVVRVGNVRRPNPLVFEPFSKG